MTIKVNLVDDFVELARTKLGLDETLDQLGVISSYAWFDLRRIPEKNWNVHLSREIQESQFYKDNKEYIDRLCEKAKSGEDLSPHSSTLISNVEGKDDMLADWGIYHLHPGHGSKVPRSEGFVNRSRELVFVYPYGDDLYFLDVLDHGAWTNFSLIQIIHENWPSTIENYRLKGVIELSHEPTEAELYQLRKNQINSAFRILDSFYIGPGGGLSSDGSSAKSVRMAMNLIELLENYSKQLKEEALDLRKTLEEISGQEVQGVLDLQLVNYNPKGGHGEILEKNSNTLLSFHFE